MQQRKRSVKVLFNNSEMEPCRNFNSHFAALHLSWIGKKQPKTVNPRGMTMFEVLKSRYSTWKRYSRTLQELESLSNRELADLGISRVDIPRLAREAARS